MTLRRLLFLLLAPACTEANPLYTTSEAVQTIVSSTTVDTTVDTTTTGAATTDDSTDTSTTSAIDTDTSTSTSPSTIGPDTSASTACDEVLYYPDGDADGFGDADAPGESACVAPPGTVDNADDCDDGDPDAFPGNSEVCDGVDNDCDGDGELDGDGDGAFACADCDDGDPDRYPGAPELCDGVDSDCDPDTLCPAQTCDDIKIEDPTAVDDDYVLYIDGDPTTPWDAYCHDMAGTPLSFLTLVNVGPDLNFSQYSAGGGSPGTDVRTNFTRVRLNPVNLRVDADDRTFASSTGQLMHGQFVVTMLPYATAEGCNNTANGLGNIDLTGTPFRVISSFCKLGANIMGTTMFSGGDQVVDFTGGGFCAWNTAGCVADPHVMPVGEMLALEYIGP